MSRNGSGKQGLVARKPPVKWFFLAVAILVIVIVAVVVTLLLLERSQDNAGREAASAATSTTGITSPYDMNELPSDTDLDVTVDASFVSIFVPNDRGTMTSYMVSSKLPSAQALIDAIQYSDEVDADAEQAANKSTITFVFPTRDTLTFTLDLDRGQIARGARAWRPKGDLRALVETAIAGP